MPATALVIGNPEMQDSACDQVLLTAVIANATVNKLYITGPKYVFVVWVSFLRFIRQAPNSIHPSPANRLFQKNLKFLIFHLEVSKLIVSFIVYNYSSTIINY